MRRKCLIHLTTGLLSFALLLCTWLLSGYTCGEIAAMDALSRLGAPYVFAKSGPEQFDCSGLVVYCYGRQGVPVSHSAKDIGEDPDSRKIDNPRCLVTGDIVCFDTMADADPFDHVGIWLGGNRFIHASSGKGEVVVSELDGYYLERFTGGRRIFCPYF